MKFRVDRDAFADAVAWAARSLPVRPSAPVLSGLLIDASDEGLVLSTFDYETSARATLTAEVADEGRALVSGRLLADICRSLPAKPVDLALDGSRVSLPFAAYANGEAYGVMVFAVQGDEIAGITGFAGRPELFDDFGLDRQLG